MQGQKFEVVIFGSLLNALYDCKTSDLDLTIIFDDSSKDKNYDHENVLLNARKIFESKKDPEMKFSQF